MSKNRLRNNTESNRIENRPSEPSAQPVASPRAHVARPAPKPCACRSLPRAAAPYRALPRPCRARPAPRAPLPPACACAQLPLACRARSLACASVIAPARARTHAALRAPAPTPARPSAQPAVSRHGCLSCDIVSPVSCHNTPGCIAIQPGLLQPFQPQYSAVYCNTLLPNKLYCNTVLNPYTPLYYNTHEPLAIQFQPFQVA